MRILLIVLDKESYINPFPLSVGYLVSAIRDRSYNDITIYNQEVYHFKDEDIKKFIEDGKFDVLGVGIYGYQQYRKAVSLFNHINASKHRPLIVLGSHGPSAAPDFFIKKFQADVVVMGEGEVVFCNLLDAFAAKRSLSQVKGIAYRNGSQIFVNEREPLIRNLDSVSFPAWDLFPIEHYVLEKHISAKHTDRCMSVLASRGCMYSCNFCYRMYKGYRLRSTENVIEEIKMLKKDYYVTHITFVDENLMCTEKHAMKFSESMRKANIGVQWNCMGRLSTAKPHILKAMKEAGCVYVNYGIESLDQKVLDAMNKDQTVEEAFTGVENTIKAGLLPGLNIISGSPGETRESIKKGAEFLRKYNLSVQVRTIKPITPYPGTEFFKLAVKKNLLKDIEDFYDKYQNTDRITVNLTDMTEQDFYEALYEANKIVLEDYYEKVKDGIEVHYSEIIS